MLKITQCLFLLVGKMVIKRRINGKLKKGFNLPQMFSEQKSLINVVGIKLNLTTKMISVKNILMASKQQEIFQEKEENT